MGLSVGLKKIREKCLNFRFSLFAHPYMNDRVGAQISNSCLKHYRRTCNDRGSELKFEYQM